MSSGPSTIPNEAPLLPRKLRNVRALWIVLIIMALLAGCALLFARGSLRLSDDWNIQLSDTLTVQVMLDSSESWTEQIDRARSAIASSVPGADIEVVSQEDARDLLSPWLGNAALPEDLPVPGLINLTGPDMSPERVQSALSEAGLNVTVNDNGLYSDQLRGTASRLVSIGIGTLILMLLAALSVNIFATRAGMTAQKDIIRVLVQVGASDKFIAKLFVGQALRRGAFGALIGLSLAALLWVILSITGDWGSLGWTTIGSGLKDVIWLIGLGIIFALFAATAAGITAARQLAFERKRL